VNNDRDGVTRNDMFHRFDACDGEVKTAIVAGLAHLPPNLARQRLAQANGLVRRALQPAAGDER